MRGAVVGSGVVHSVLLIGMFAAQTHAPRLIVGPDVVQVALIDPQATTAAAPAAKSEPAPARTPDLKPEEGTGVKLAPPPKPKTPKEATPPPETAPPPPALALASAPTGRAGLKGDVAVDSGDFAFSYYLVLVRNRIAQNWTPPAGLVAGGQPIRTVVYFRIDRDGSVRDARLEAPSPAEFFDRSALRAVTLSDPLPPLPAGYAGSSLGVHFGFEYAAP